MDAINKVERNTNIWNFLLITVLLSGLLLFTGYSLSNNYNILDKQIRKDASMIPHIKMQIDSLNKLYYIIDNTVKQIVELNSLDGINNKIVEIKKIIKENGEQFAVIKSKIDKVSRDSSSIPNFFDNLIKLEQLHTKISLLHFENKLTLPSGDCSSIQNELNRIKEGLAQAKNNCMQKNADLKDIKKQAEELRGIKFKNGILKNNKDQVIRLDDKIQNITSTINNAISTNN